MQSRLAGRVTWAAFGLAAAIELGLIAGGGGRFSALLSDLTLPGAALLAALACTMAARARRGRLRLGWVLMAMGMGLVSVGALVHSTDNLVFGTRGGTTASGPFYLLGALAALASLGTLPLLPRGGLRGVVATLDGLVLTCALFIVAWYVALDPLYMAGSGPVADRLLPVLYLGSTVVLELLVLLQLSSARGDLRAGTVFALAFLAMVMTNGAYLYLELTGRYVTGGPIDGGWPACYLLVGAGALLADPTHERLKGRVDVFLSALPYVATIGAVALAGSETILRGGYVDPPIVIMAVLLGLFVCLRMIVGQRDQRQLVSDLADAKQRVEDVLEAAPIILFTLDAGGRVLLSRGPLAAAVDLEGERLPHELRLAVEAALAGQSREVEVSIGDLRLDFRLRPTAAEGPVRVFGMAVDVSEQRRAEAALRESAAKTRFLAQMSHELRTPLNSVLGFTQMLQMGQDPLTERQSRWLGNVRSSADHLLALINDVLDISKVSAGQVEVEVEPLAVASVVARAVSKVRPLAAERNLALSAAIEDAQALADDRRLEQVLLNLLANAIKFTPPGGEVRVRAESAGDEVRVDVIDTGIGIRAEDQQRIFEEFTQLSDGRTRTEEGTGLGLALSRRLCDLMGARLELESEAGRGSRFTVVLRAAAAAVPAGAA